MSVSIAELNKLPDRKLLELAAEVIGLDLTNYTWNGECFTTGIVGKLVDFNPLNDDGEVFRLAIMVETGTGHFWERMRAVRETLNGTDAEKTRRAIVLTVCEMRR